MVQLVSAAHTAQYFYFALAELLLTTVEWRIVGMFHWTGAVWEGIEAVTAAAAETTSDASIMDESSTRGNYHMRSISEARIECMMRQRQEIFAPLRSGQITLARMALIIGLRNTAVAVAAK